MAGDGLARGFRSGRAFLATPQYWAWRLSGIMASEVTSLAAQSHLWCAIDGRPGSSPTGAGEPDAAAAAGVGDARDAAAGLVRAHRPCAVKSVCGIHDSSASLYGYQAAGLADMTLVSTGTWIVGISDRHGPVLDAERPGICSNADVKGS